MSWFDQLMLSFQSVITPAPSEDWAFGPGTIADHVQRLKTVKREVIGTLKINSIFNLLNVLPLVYLGKHELINEILSNLPVSLQTSDCIFSLLSLSNFLF